MPKNMTIIPNDDYAFAENDDMQFYFGYEYVYCKNHNEFFFYNEQTQSEHLVCFEDGVVEWAFYAKSKKNGKILYSASLQDICRFSNLERKDEPATHLIAGILAFIKRGTPCKNRI